MTDIPRERVRAAFLRCSNMIGFRPYPFKEVHS